MPCWPAKSPNPNTSPGRRWCRRDRIDAGVDAAVHRRGVGVGIRSGQAPCWETARWLVRKTRSTAEASLTSKPAIRTMSGRTAARSATAAARASSPWARPAASCALDPPSSTASNVAIRTAAGAVAGGDAGVGAAAVVDGPVVDGPGSVLSTLVEPGTVVMVVVDDESHVVEPGSVVSTLDSVSPAPWSWSSSWWSTYRWCQ